MQISNQPPKGTSDWFPEEYQIRKYIFDTWRKVCTRFGYEEYLTPILEDADIYRAKSGEDVGGKELLIMKDRAGRELAIRPEMTPSVTRMVSRKYRELMKPVRYFSIANYFRNEKPQRGRNREFWQLNYDVFGSDSIEADIEIAQVALEIMLEFNPPKDSFVLYLNSRKVIDDVLDNVAKVSSEAKTDVIRILDKLEKIGKEEVSRLLTEKGLSVSQVEILVDRFMGASDLSELEAKLPELKGRESLTEFVRVLKSLDDLGYGDYVKFNPSIMRGFDYYDGTIFECFDKNPENPRAMFGGGRYNGLASVFGAESFPAVGCAPGDETTRLFFESWGLTEKIREQLKETVYYLPMISDNTYKEINIIAKKLRGEGKTVVTGLDLQKIGKAFGYADKRGYDYVILIGENEKAEGKYLIKDMKSGEELKVLY